MVRDRTPPCFWRIWGAEVLRINRPGGNGYPNPIVDSVVSSLTIDIRTDEGRDKCLEIVEKVDVVIEGNRPGVMVRLGLGPSVMMVKNPRLICARMTGWGQTRPSRGGSFPRFSANPAGTTRGGSPDR